MVAAAEIAPNDRVFEIGPGPGILTTALLAAGADVLAAEIDAKLCTLLRDRFSSPQFALHHGDALVLPNAEICKKGLSRLSQKGTDPFCEYKVAANLPYNITSAVLEKFLFEAPKPTSLTIMIQREVADRILAKLGEMSSLAVMVQTMGEARLIRRVPRGSFYPPPKVDSSVIQIILKSERELDALFDGMSRDSFFTFVRTAFGQKRKQLKNSLLGMANITDLETAAKAAGIPLTARPEELSVAQWIGFAQHLLRKGINGST